VTDAMEEGRETRVAWWRGVSAAALVTADTRMTATPAAATVEISLLGSLGFSLTMTFSLCSRARTAGYIRKTSCTL
jgi:hypothetical protein